MARSQAQKKADKKYYEKKDVKKRRNEYYKNRYTKVSVNFEKGERDLVKSKAELQGKNVSNYVRDLLYLELENSELNNK